MASAVNYEPLKRAFEEAGQYRIDEVSKFADSSIFQIKDKEKRIDFTFSSIKQKLPADCINSDDKTLQFFRTMNDQQFILGILFWGSKVDKKRPASDARVYSCDVPELLANLHWINNEIGSIHKLNNGQSTQ